MQYTVPDYYKDFKCIASECPDTCCAGWDIMIDDRSLARYKKVKGGFGNRLHNSINWKEKCFEQCGNRCAFLNEEDLCDIYSECGEDMLCDTCANYPRHTEEFEDLKEVSLAISCPAAARLILGRDSKVEFITTEVDEECEEYEEFDYFLFTNLMDARKVIIDILQDRGVNYRLRTAMVLAFAHDFQVRLNKGRLYEIDELIDRYTRPDAQKKFAKRLLKYSQKADEAEEYVKDMFGLLPRMEVLKNSWPDYVSCAMEELFDRNKLVPAVSDAGLRWEQLMVYFVFTYFCGAVYDSDAFGKMKLAVSSTLLIMELNKIYDDVEDVAHAFSREMEHSEENMKIVEENMNRNAAFAMDKLMTCILNR